MGKPGLVIRTLDFYEKSYPGSVFKNEMHFCEQTYIRTDLQRQAERSCGASYFSQVLGGALLSVYLAVKQVEANNH